MHLELEEHTCGNQQLFITSGIRATIERPECLPTNPHVLHQRVAVVVHKADHDVRLRLGIDHDACSDCRMHAMYVYAVCNLTICLLFENPMAVQ